jgi:hypothetical protein
MEESGDRAAVRRTKRGNRKFHLELDVAIIQFLEKAVLTFEVSS